MPWSPALPQALFTSPSLSTTTPVAIGSFVGYLVNRQRTQDTYRTLRQPPFYPSPRLFGPVWTVLYGMMGYAAHHATLAATDPHDLANSQILYTSQLVLNYLWMPLFFGLRRPALALADIVLLGGNVAALMTLWWKVDRLAFWLMVPYAGWLGFATYLNASLGFLNGWDIGGKRRQ